VIGRVAGAAALAGVACFGYGLLVESRAFRVRRVRVPVLPAGARSVRVLHVSDFHLTSGQKAKRAFISALGGLEPDVVVSTGDNLSEPEALGPLLHDLARLLEVPGVFVFGSNDYSAPAPVNPLGYLGRSTEQDGVRADRVPLPSEELRKALTDAGWADLNGRRASVRVQGLNLEFRGTDDAHLALDDYGLVAGPPAPGTDLTIGVTHAPYRRVLDAMTADGVQLILAGHTHGGQVCVPGWGALTTNCDLPPSQAKGLSVHHGPGGRTSALHVSAGVGSSPYAPYRFACPPEVTVLTLTGPEMTDPVWFG
jgi:predicted MPP superfamily phosphohydrolase